MSKLAALKATTTLAEMAKLLQMKPSALAYILYKLAPNEKYSSFEIPKRRGGLRPISAPTQRLKLVQSKLSILLQDCLDEIRGESNSRASIAHGFIRGHSIITNARQHKNRRYVFNVDLQEFFPSINFGRVRGYFIHDRKFALHKDVATLIAHIACHDNALPQGSPSSPVISNLVTHILDVHLVRLANSTGCTYSRYADDLTFSTNKKLFPVEIARQSADDPNTWIPGKELNRLITRSGFITNPSKTRMQYRDSRQEVTGLVVNRRINVRHDYRHNVRAMVHSLFRRGYFELNGATVKEGGGIVIESRRGTLDELHGRLGFIDYVDNTDRRHGKQPPIPARKSNETMYRQFLIYKDFYSSQVPVILCEGVTDNIYLANAIRFLASEFPELADSVGDKLKLRVRLYKYTKSSTARILDLHDGGSSILAKFISTYKRDTDRFTAPGLSNPVILLYDSDDGAKPIRNTIKQVCATIVKGTEPFVHVVKNLYAVPTPIPPGGSASTIEDFFDEDVKATVLGGKSFNAGKDADSEIHYGKKLFAEHVVRARATSIDFSGFRTLLANLAAVIRTHSTGQR